MRRVLHVEDERMLTTTLKVLLAPEWEAIAVESVAAARGALADPALSAVICDLSLPDGTAEDVYAAVRAGRPDLAGRFIVTTGGATTDATERLLLSAGLPALAKPFDIDELVRRLRGFTAP